MNRKESRILSYCFYGISLVPLLILPDSWWRLFYLYTVSTFLFFFSDFKARIFLLVGVAHSVIHHIWPFLHPGGYDLSQPPFFDVAWHCFMMVMCYGVILHWSKKHRVLHYNTFYYISVFFIIGSVINTATSISNGESTSDFAHHLFTWMSVFQAVSTGYWIGTLCSWEKWDQHFFPHLLGNVAFIVGNWALYKWHEPFVGLSMKYHYIEAIFICSAWVPGLNKLNQL
jgi:hypothetical protein